MFWGKDMYDLYFFIDACFVFKCEGTVSLWVTTMSVMNVF